MVPKKIAETLQQMRTPDFFAKEHRAATEEIHDILRECIEQATDTMTIELDWNLLLLVEKVLKVYGWTVEETLVLYVMWCITCPDDYDRWLAEIEEGRKENDEENADPVQAGVS